ncbi:MAG: YHS domain-containing protein [Chloroflexi bacterium]|nr:YHS domain-containing protein [Chloroflexota bacterium]
MELTLLEGDDARVRAGYNCPCGCTPSVEYVRDAGPALEGCCCGNQFAVGPNAAASLRPKDGYRPALQVFDAPWGERLDASWLIGPSVHGPSGGEVDSGHEHEHEHEHETGSPSERAIDPVCGMTVATEAARAKGLYSSLEGGDFFFCGKGCKLEFDEDPGRYLAPEYVPSM